MNEPKKNKKIKKEGLKEGLFVPSRQLSMMMAGGLLGIALIFLGGYMIGQKYAMQGIVAEIEQEAFADQLYASVCALDTSEGLCEQLLARGDADKTLHTVAQTGVPDARKEAVAAEVAQAAREVAEADSAYVGQLISYHMRHYAEGFVQKIARKDIPLEIRTRSSVTASGEVKEWYQVVTKRYKDRAELEQIMGQLAQEENIKGAQIVVCS